MTSVHARLKEERRKTGLSQGDFARLGGVGRNSQFEYESGKTAPNTNYLTAIGQHGVDLCFIITGQRSVDSLDKRTSELITIFERLTPEWQSMIVALIRQAASSSTVVEEAGRHGEHPTI